MGKALGYILSLVGLAIILFSSKIATLPVISSIAKISIYTIVVGVALIVVGVIFMMDGSSPYKVKHAAEEVPIYEGEGKKKRIVGYKRAK
jgi:hypothetical protein